jgi:hypothetical protein
MYLAVANKQSAVSNNILSSHLVLQLSCYIPREPKQIGCTSRQTNSGALVRKRTIPTERPLLVGEVSAHFSG